MYMDMILTDHPFQNGNVESVASLAQQLPATHLHLTRQYMIAVFSAPYQLKLKVVNRVATRPLLFHATKLR